MSGGGGAEERQVGQSGGFIGGPGGNERCDVTKISAVVDEH